MSLYRLEEHGPRGIRADNLLVQGDNLEAARLLAADYAGRVGLLYLDPPFATGQAWGYSVRGQVHHAYDDRWPGGLAAYGEWMAPRLEAAAALLAPDGALYLHCDTGACHVLRVLLDRILGEHRFRAQIAWRRTTSHPDAHYYGSVHDVILFYADRWHRMNPVHHDRDPEMVQRYYRYRDPDGRLFMSDNLTGAGQGPARDFRDRGVLEPPPGRHWLTDQEGIDRLLAQGRIFWTRNGVPRLKKYLDEAEGIPAADLWTDIQPLRSWHRREATGYATQKPEALLERIVRASSSPGTLVADLFCGSGTTLAVAERLGRPWLGCDQGAAAVQVARRRLLGLPGVRPFAVASVGPGPEPLAAPEVALEAGRVHLRGLRGRSSRWTSEVDAWAVQWQPGDGAFRPDWWGVRDERGCLPLESGVGASDESLVRVYGTSGALATARVGGGSPSDPAKSAAIAPGGGFR